MGSNPFWPTYLASLNVLCVPTANVSAQRFAELFNALSTIREIRTADVKSGHAVTNGPIFLSHANLLQRLIPCRPRWTFRL
jgi:hypothetical protein